MTKKQRLIKEAKESCKFRGHQMKPFSHKYAKWSSSKCKICGMFCHVNADPLPNEIDISGEAVALHCECNDEAELNMETIVEENRFEIY